MPEQQDGGAADLVPWLQKQCNRWVNGSCQTHNCLVRGGWKRGQIPDYQVATCEPYEIVKLLQARKTI